MFVSYGQKQPLSIESQHKMRKHTTNNDSFYDPTIEIFNNNIQSVEHLSHYSTAAVNRNVRVECCKTITVKVSCWCTIGDCIACTLYSCVPEWADALVFQLFWKIQIHLENTGRSWNSQKHRTVLPGKWEMSQVSGRMRGQYELRQVISIMASYF